MSFDERPVERPSRINAARLAAREVTKLDELLDELAPLDVEAHPESPQGRAWAGLVGIVARATLRADEVIEAETPLKMAATWNDGKRQACWVRDPKPAGRP